MNATLWDKAVEWAERATMALYIEGIAVELERITARLGSAPYPNEDPRYPSEHPLSVESNAAARASGAQIPKGRP